MSSSNDNTVYKKTSFLAGMNSEFINEFYADYISYPMVEQYVLFKISKILFKSAY